MFKKILFLFSLASLSSEIFAYPSFAHGNDLYPTCNYIVEDIKHIKNTTPIKTVLELAQKKEFCLTATAVAFDTVTTFGYTWDMNVTTVACIDEFYGFSNFTALQVLDMTITYLKAHPEYRDARIGTIVGLMIHEKYPVPEKCKK